MTSSLNIVVYLSSLQNLLKQFVAKQSPFGTLYITNIPDLLWTFADKLHGNPKGLKALCFSFKKEKSIAKFKC